MESAIRSAPRLCDVTLRDGEQAVDAAFTIEEKAELAAELEGLGVHQVQVGFARGDGPETARLIKASGARVPIELLCFVFKDDWRHGIDLAADSGADVVQLLMRTSDPLLDVAGLTQDSALERVVASVRHAIGAGVETVVLGASFATQADPEFLARLSTAAVDAGAVRVVVADTVGVATPEGVASLVDRLTKAVEVPVGIHCHDDFGLAVANTLAGLQAGATWADLSVCGLGERAGNAALEAVVMALGVLYGADVAVKSERLKTVADRLAMVLRTAISPSQPVVGDHVFAQKLDLHIEVESAHTGLLEPFDPALVGNRRAFRLGKGSGPRAIQDALARLGCLRDGVDILGLVSWVNTAAEQSKACVTDAELLRELQRRSGSPERS